MKLIARLTILLIPFILSVAFIANAIADESAPQPADERKESATAAPFELTYESAIKSEWIAICEFEGYDKSRTYTWDDPPTANFRVTDILKGPPCCAGRLPVKYTFHDLIHTDVPMDWKFSDELMPKKNSKWILFIEYAVPRQGKFDLYQGSFGRQPATKENLTRLYALLDKYNMRNAHS
jgi:hypothetical protein